MGHTECWHKDNVYRESMSECRHRCCGNADRSGLFYPKSSYVRRRRGDAVEVVGLQRYCCGRGMRRYSCAPHVRPARDMRGMCGRCRARQQYRRMSSDSAGLRLGVRPSRWQCGIASVCRRAIALSARRCACMPTVGCARVASGMYSRC